MPAEEAGRRASGQAGHRPTRNPEPGTRNVLHRFLAALRRVAGMPDYAAYVEHLRACHPDRPIPTEREYFADYTEARYGSGVSRCC